MMLYVVFVCFFGVLVLVFGDKDPFLFNEETCVKIFRRGDNFFKIRCLHVFQDENDEPNVGLTILNHRIVFKKIAYFENEHKICVSMFTEGEEERYCFEEIKSNCVSDDKDLRNDFLKRDENVACSEVNLDEKQWFCMGIDHQDFTLVLYCTPFLSNYRRTIINFPYNKPPERQ